MMGVVVGASLVGGAAAWGQAPAGVATTSATGGATGGAKLGSEPLFDEKADAAGMIVQAREKAKAEGRGVLVLWGANGSDVCAHMNTLLHDDASIKRLIATEYLLVRVDVAKYDKNLELGTHYGVDIPTLGIPNLTVIDAASDAGVATLPGRDAAVKPRILPRVFDEVMVAKFLDANKPRQVAATQLLAEAQGRAVAREQRVLVWFGAWGCASCEGWERVVESPEGMAILNKAFVTRKIDVGRNIGADVLLKRLAGRDDAVAGWMTVLDGQGKESAEAHRGHGVDAGLGAWLVSASGGKLSAEDGAAVQKLMQAGGTAGATGGAEKK